MRYEYSQFQLGMTICIFKHASLVSDNWNDVVFNKLKKNTMTAGYVVYRAFLLLMLVPAYNFTAMYNGMPGDLKKPIIARVLGRKCFRFLITCQH